MVNYPQENQYADPLLDKNVGGLGHYDEIPKPERIGDKYREMVTEHTAAVALVSVTMFHKDARNWGKRTFGTVNLYHELVHRMCPHLQFNEQAKNDLKATRQSSYDLPDTLRHTTSAAFHVRRTDKVSKSESIAYPCTDYVNQLMHALESDGVRLEDVEICFLATDDYTVHTEMQQALDAVGLTCRLVYTAPSAEFQKVSPGDTSQRYEADAALVFLTEFSVMLEATYLMGTFNSNIEALAGVLRACPGGYDANKHYAQTYGVDGPAWFFR